MSSTERKKPAAPTELPEPVEPPKSEVRRGSRALVVALFVTLAALVWALNPRQPRLRPAPLQPPPPACPSSHAAFVPTNATEIPGLPLDTLPKKAKNRALLRLNMEPCSCGCNQSLATCRAADRACAVSAAAAKDVVDEESANATAGPLQ